VKCFGLDSEGLSVLMEAVRAHPPNLQWSGPGLALLAGRPLTATFARATKTDLSA